MKVRIGISTYNRSKILPKAIQSALNQSYPYKEIAVFDDCSTDSTAALKAIFSQVTWIQSDINRGYIHARNYLMRETDADLYVSLDDDAWFVNDDEIALGVQFFQENPKIAAIAYDILTPDSSCVQLRSAPYPTHMFIGCGHMLRLSYVRQLSYYAAFPGSYGGEEKDLSLRFLDQGYEILFLPGVHVWHDRSEVARDLAAQHSSGVCNDLTFAWRRSPISMLIWLIPAKILSHLRFALTYRETNFISPCLTGILLFFLSLPQATVTRDPASSKAFLEFIKRSRNSRSSDR